MTNVNPHAENKPWLLHNSQMYVAICSDVYFLGWDPFSVAVELNYF